MSSNSSKSVLPPRPRRRQHERYPLVAPLRVKCSSWPSFRELFTLNVAKMGLFIPTDTQANTGEVAQLVMHAPDGSAFRLSVVVRHVLGATEQRPAGLGVEVVEVSEADQPHYEALVEQAAEPAQVRPKAQTGSGSAPKPEPSSSASSPRPTPAPRQPAPTPPRAPHKPQPIVAIDFGTSRSSVSVVRKQEAVVVRLPEGGWDIPSVVGFLDSGSVVVGTAAREMLTANPTCAIRSPKRLLGRLANDRELEPYLAALPMPHSAGPDGGLALHPRGGTYTVAQVCAPIIFQLRSVAEQHLGQPVEQAVFTTPVSYDKPRFRALQEAARLAGLRISEFIDEPTAAALAHRFDPTFNGLVAVYDFGGGTFDFSIVKASDGDLDVVATAGDTWLGGDDFDEVLANAAANDFWRQNNIELRHDAVQWQRVLFAAELAKRELSARQEAVMTVPQAALRASGSIDLRFQVNRQQFADLAAPIIERSLDTCAQAMDLNDVKPQELSAIYLSGGTSYIPAIRDALARHFGQAPRAVVPPERAVVCGAAIYASMLRSGGVQR